MSETFRDKRVLITGASRGVGQKLAEDFAASGAKVAVNYNTSTEAADRVVSGITDNGGAAFAVQADIGVSQDVAALFDQIDARLGGIDILINNAGINRDGPITAMSDEDWDAVMATNLRGPFLCTRAAVVRMQSNGGGRIVNISAVTSEMGRANASNYSASKGGLNAMTRALAVELGPDITVNAILLGFFDSPLVREVFAADQIAAVEAGLPAGRLGQFSEVSGMVRYLCSDAAAFVTGQCLNLDGGQNIRLS